MITWLNVQFTARYVAERNRTWVHASLRDCSFVNVSLFLPGSFIPTEEQQLEVLRHLRQAFLVVHQKLDRYLQQPRVTTHP